MNKQSRRVAVCAIALMTAIAFRRDGVCTIRVGGRGRQSAHGAVCRRTDDDGTRCDGHESHGW
jgi:hypothetical protein